MEKENAKHFPIERPRQGKPRAGVMSDAGLQSEITERVRNKADRF